MNQYLTRSRAALLPLLLTAMLGGCALSPVDNATDDSIRSQVHAGMTMTDARTEMESMNYLCSTHTGSYFDENGEEHVTNSSFVICGAQPGAVSFVCANRTQVTLVPDGGRVQSVVISQSPSCVRQ